MMQRPTHARRTHRRGTWLAAMTALAGLATAIVPGLAPVPAGAAPMGTTDRVSITTAGTDMTFDSSAAAISADGRWVAFETTAPLVAIDKNGVSDVYARNRLSGFTTLVSINKDATAAGNAASTDPSISADGRRIAFASEATDLITTFIPDTFGFKDVFVRNMNLGSTLLSSVAKLPTYWGNGASYDPDISADGEHVAFASSATNLVDGDTDAAPDIFVGGADKPVSLVSVPAEGGDGQLVAAYPSISGDGALVAFSTASKLVPADVNNVSDVYLWYRSTSKVAWWSMPPGGVQPDGDSIDPSISANGFLLAFESKATNLLGPGQDTNAQSDVFVNMAFGKITRINVASDGSEAKGGSTSRAVVSADGKWVAYETRATNAVVDDKNGTSPDIQRRDTLGTGLPQTMSAGSNGPGNSSSMRPAISADGRYVAFDSVATDLIAGDGNGKRDVFVRNPELPTATSISPWSLGRGEEKTVSLKGSGFTATPLISPIPGATIKNVSWVSPAELSLTIATAADASPGARDVIVRNPAGDEATCGGCLMVTLPIGPAGPDGPGPDGPGVEVPPAPDKVGYWMVGSDGTVYAFGDAAHVGDPSPSAHPVVDLEPTPAGDGYWVIDDHGVVSAYNAKHYGNADPSKLAAGERVTSLSATPAGDGYWVFTSRGRVLAFGNAAHRGDMSAVTLNGPVLDSIPTPSGNGYYMVASDGGIFTFGDAEFLGSMGAVKLNAPVQSLVPDPDGKGYWLVASDGGIFAFDAPFRGSMGGVKLNKPVTGMVAFGNGYLMVAEDGGIFNFSDKEFLGSLGANPPANPIVSVAAL